MRKSKAQSEQRETVADTTHHTHTHRRRRTAEKQDDEWTVSSLVSTAVDALWERTLEMESEEGWPQ